MQRNIITPRLDWAKKIESRGFGFHSTDIPYWNESVCYQFKMDEILFIEKATVLSIPTPIYETVPLPFLKL